MYYLEIVATTSKWANVGASMHTYYLFLEKQQSYANLKCKSTDLLLKCGYNFLEVGF